MLCLKGNLKKGAIISSTCVGRGGGCKVLEYRTAAFHQGEKKALVTPVYNSWEAVYNFQWLYPFRYHLPVDGAWGFWRTEQKKNLASLRSAQLWPAFPFIFTTALWGWFVWERIAGPRLVSKLCGQAATGTGVSCSPNTTLLPLYHTVPHFCAPCTSFTLAFWTQQMPQ